MENYISQQLMIFVRSILLGVVIALLYDLLRPVRKRCPGSIWLLDGGYCAAAALLTGLFLLRQGDGELRLYILLGAVGGAVLFFSLASDVLHTVWEFWAETAVLTGQLLVLPAQKAVRLCKKILIRCKNLFYFAGKYYTIRKNGGMGKSHAISGGRSHGKKSKQEAGQGKGGLFHKNHHCRAAGSPDMAAEHSALSGSGR